MAIIFYQVSLFFTFLHRKIDHFVPYKFDTTLFIGSFEVFVVFYLCQFLALKFQYTYLGAFSFFVISIAAICLNSYYFHFLKNEQRIMKGKPMLWKSKVASIVLSISFFCLCIALSVLISREVQDLLAQYRRMNINI
jgi:preprotein translocase subunit SecG